MNNLGLTLDGLRERVAKRTHKTERGELLIAFMEILNMSRKGTKYKQLSIASTGVILQHIPTTDLYYLFSICTSAGKRSPNYANGFSRTLFWEIKTRPPTRPR